MKYLQGMRWEAITREERFFCAALYQVASQQPKPLLRLLDIDADPEAVEIGYEVCFYRDLLHLHGQPVSQSPFSNQRTFDLTVFTDRKIYIIEAKAHEGFTNKQLESIKQDKTCVPKLCGIEAAACAIVSSRYRPKAETRRHFAQIITWQQLAEKYPAQAALFARADGIFGN